MSKSELLGTEKISKLLIQQAVPAAIGFALMAINMLVDTIFVGQFVGKFGVGAVSIVTPIAFLMSSFGMAIGIGGASIVSRAFGAKDRERANLAFNNQISLALIVISFFALISFIFKDQILLLFGAVGALKEPSDIYYSITMIGVPFLSLAMTGNNNLRAEGKANQAMMVLLIPSILNMILDAIFIYGFDWGMEGAAWATTISFFSSGGYILYFYLSGKGELKVMPYLFKLRKAIVKEIVGIGSVSIVRQGSISILVVLLNHTLFVYGNLDGIGGENAISVYAIATRISMFAFFPLIGIAQGLVPIAGYNYGAKRFDRVQEVIRLSNISGFFIASFLCGLLLLFSDQIPYLFVDEKSLDIIPETSKAIFYVFMGSFLVVFQLVGASYYQALGKAIPALLLTLTKQLFFLVPFVVVLPKYWGLNGIWYSFTIADILSAAVCYYFLHKGLQKMMKREM
jgi:putative MATE family efflux protein